MTLTFERDLDRVISTPIYVRQMPSG